MAQRPLLETDRTFSEIAFSCSFFDACHFSRDFKRVVGTSPSLWRNTELGVSQPGTARRKS